MFVFQNKAHYIFKMPIVFQQVRFLSHTFETKKYLYTSSVTYMLRELFNLFTVVYS